MSAREMTLADHREIESEGGQWNGDHFCKNPRTAPNGFTYCGCPDVEPAKPAEFSGQRVADYVLKSQPAMVRILKHDGLFDLVRYDLASAAWEGYMAGLRVARSSEPR